MKRIILILTSFVFCIAIANTGSSANTFIKNQLVIKDTLPVTDTVGQGNWQHTLRSDTAKNIDSSFMMKAHQDSMHKAPPLPM